MEENPNAGTHNDESDQEIEYDAEGNPIVPVKSKVGVQFHSTHWITTLGAMGTLPFVFI